MLGRLWDWWRTKKPLVDAAFMAPLLLMSALIIWNGSGFPVPDIALVLALCLPLVLRRTYPRAVFATVALSSFFQCVAGVDLLPANIAVLMGIYTLAADQPRIWGLAAAAVGELGAAMAALRYGGAGDDSKGMFIMLSIQVWSVWILGTYISTRRAYTRSVEERAERLEKERDQEVQMAMAAERARIARELHDVVAHNVSVIVVQADGASYAIETDTARAKEALETISVTGRQALAEMRRLLGVLREGDDAGSYAPQPGVGQLGDLVEQVRTSGLPLDFEVTGTPHEMSEGRQLTVFRIVQEGLTNTLKHAGPKAAARVRLHYGDEAVEVRIVDDGRGAAAANDGRGHGLAGMRERAAVYGGTVDAGPRPGGGFEVIARIPVREEVPA
ncbi:sensor histidine kinase [Actinomadura rudentiformis]|uniref:histidine kinase n=1 Tax=Actinomadura rudentiformis TaxID=359158 RepID=A0A6H9YX67_9ACTN|nr:sensor histidine kinase [Actinomadura rudentiformis]KAB2350815.1 sensor histidine kinase [Actinomadura rudentiformis]